MLKIGVILSGCGVMDGAEIHESVLTLLAITTQGAEPVCMAPNVDQAHVINHLTGKESNEKRNVLVESARIARGKIKDIKDMKAADVDAVILPGGYGAAKNLCSFAFDGSNAKVNPDVEKFLKEMHRAGKPIGAICIAPAVTGKLFGSESVKLTIGTDKGTAEALEKMGAQHENCSVSEICVDNERRIVSTPAYMLAKNLAEANEGIEKLVTEILHMIKQPVKK